MSKLEQKVLDVLTQTVPKLTEKEQDQMLFFGLGLTLNPRLKDEEEDENERQQH